ncbi:MAG TPA: NHLP leader peptide family RiPP precursor, partial [Acidimicrobiales bacterium]|nr:NHLP leader peptide family RiPP precursor [Acidimicrobiales bacterium]
TGRAAIERRIIDRAQSDPGFRTRLLQDPRGALGELLGVALPDGIEVRVVEERPDLMCVVLPVDLSGMGYDAIWAMLGERP